MLMDEDTFSTPPNVNFCDFQEANTFEPFDCVAAQSELLSFGRDTVVARNLNSIEKLAECIHSVGHQTEQCMAC